MNATAKVGFRGATPTLWRVRASQATVTCVSQTIGNLPTPAQKQAIVEGLAPAVTF